MGADDVTVTNNVANEVLGGRGGDKVTITGDGNNTVYSNGGDDVVVISGSGNNFVHAGRGNDKITGGSGSDTIQGGQGDNVYTGGAGADTFQYTAGSLDILTDFSFAQGDRLNLQGQSYGVTAASDGSAALTFADGGVIILQGITEVEFSSSYLV